MGWKKIIYHPGNEVDQDSLYIRTTSIGVTEFESILSVTDGTMRTDFSQIDWNSYQVSAPLESSYNVPSLSDVELIGSSGTSDRATGWYYKRAWFRHHVVAGLSTYENYSPTLTNPLVDMEIRLEMPDQYLVIDGQMITFLEFREEPESSINVEDITMPDGAPARVYTLEGRQHFLGKNFYVAAIDTVYQLTPAQAAATSGYPVHHSAPTHKASKSHTRTAPQLPPPYRNTPYVEYGGAPLGMKVPPMTVNGKIMK